MCAVRVNFTLSYAGGSSDDSEIDFYDVSQALIGFQRSLALTTHLIVNGEIITQAPALKGAHIFVLPAHEGSWKITAAVVVGVAYGVQTLTTAPRDVPLGHLVHSAYDYAVSEILGFHVDYDKTLLQQYRELKKSNPDVEELPQAKFDALTEKCEKAITDMHRPIISSEAATITDITTNIGHANKKLSHPLSRSTFDYINLTEKSESTSDFIGKISSFNINTNKRRIYVVDEGRPISFELDQSVRNRSTVERITSSLAINGQIRHSPADRSNVEIVRNSGLVRLKGFRITARTGRLIKISVVDVSPWPPNLSDDGAS